MRRLLGANGASANRKWRHGQAEVHWADCSVCVKTPQLASRAGRSALGRLLRAKRPHLLDSRLRPLALVRSNSFPSVSCWMSVVVLWPLVREYGGVEGWGEPPPPSHELRHHKSKG